MTPQSPKLPRTPLNINTEARGGGDANISRECFFLFLFSFFFIEGEKKNRRERESRHSSELNAFFKVELNFVQNPPGGRHY